jgi:hypothetical protein
MREDRLRLGKQNKSCGFILYFAHLALSLDKLRCGSEIKNEKLRVFILYFAHLAVTLQAKRNDNL